MDEQTAKEIVSLYNLWINCQGGPYKKAHKNHAEMRKVYAAYKLLDLEMPEGVAEMLLARAICSDALADW